MKEREEKSPKEASHMEEREPLSIELSFSCMKHINQTKEK
jgi:hypothetical protein